MWWSADRNSKINFQKRRSCVFSPISGPFWVRVEVKVRVRVRARVRGRVGSTPVPVSDQEMLSARKRGLGLGEGLGLRPYLYPTRKCFLFAS